MCRVLMLVIYLYGFVPADNRSAIVGKQELANRKYGKVADLAKEDTLEQGRSSCYEGGHGNIRFLSPPVFYEPSHIVSFSPQYLYKRFP